MYFVSLYKAAQDIQPNQELSSSYDIVTLYHTQFWILGQIVHLKLIEHVGFYPSSFKVCLLMFLIMPLLKWKPKHGSTSS